jgi:hypothetical protein
MDTPKRPPDIVFCSLYELYEHFITIFMDGKENLHEFISKCGCKITVLDHHFFHMVKLQFPGKEKLFMRDEKAGIILQNNGFGEYTYDAHRARHLPSAMETLVNPDCVCRPERLKAADRVFIKKYDSLPYQFTAVLVGIRDGGFKVPVTAFPVKGTDIRRWIRGIKLFP